jgi:uncharacterized protein
MADPVVHFEIIGRQPEALRRYYAELFGWHAIDAPVAPEVSDAGGYGFVEKIPVDDRGTGIPGGIGGGPGFSPQVLVYVAVPEVEQALRRAEAAGGTRVLGPVARPDGGLVVGRFRDPEGNVLGVAGPR